MKIGIDVGGTNTDAVLIDSKGKIVASHKSATTPDPMNGIDSAVFQVIQNADKKKITQVMLGTTHATNAIIQRRHLGKIGVIRLGAPATTGVLAKRFARDDIRSCDYSRWWKRVSWCPYFCS